MEQYNLFSTPLFRSYFEQENLNSIIDDFKFIEKKHNAFYTINSFTSHSIIDNILKKEQLKDLKKFIISQINKINIISEINNAMEIDCSWFSINRFGGYHEEHNHLPSIWSGVYYIKAEDSDSNITFINKNLTDTGWPYTTNKNSSNPIVSQQTSCSVSAGMLLIFPGYLKHKVEQQTRDSERITISFNTKLI
jgi:uncharacterized protein (TIGR02466 family)